MSYLVNMAPRLVELHRILKPSGSLYLHCDPTMSHYLKILLDTVFGAERFLSEMIWKRSGAHSGSKRWNPVHDVILFYGKGPRHTWNQVLQPLPQETLDEWYNNVEPGTDRRYNRQVLTGPGTRAGQSGQSWRGIDPGAKGRHWAIPGVAGEIVAGLSTHEALDKLDASGRLHWPAKVGGVPMFKWYLDEAKGVPALDVVTDIARLSSRAAERLGYPTQKPLALLERIVRVSTNPGDIVLDPFCGCGTTIDAAQRMDRQWVGIDIAYIAVDLIEKRLRHTYGPEIASTYQVGGIPRDLRSARRLFDKSPFEFERWAVSLVNGTPNQKQVGDKGVDGVVRFWTDTKGSTGRVLVSVKGGKQIGPAFVRDLLGTVQTQRAEMGSLITLAPFTRGMKDAIDHAGTYQWPINGHPFPKAQIATIEDLLAGRKLDAPPSLLPYIPADRHSANYAQLSLL